MIYFLYSILRIKNYLLSYFSNQNGRLIVVLYHDVNTNQIDKFASQIDWFKAGSALNLIREQNA